jgi:hypothetical protein
VLKGEQSLVKIELGMGYNPGSIIEEGIEISFSPSTGFRDQDPGAMEAITLIEFPWVGIFKACPELDSGWRRSLAGLSW